MHLYSDTHHNHLKRATQGLLQRIISYAKILMNMSVPAATAFCGKIGASLHERGINIRHLGYLK
jgi:hypothetical protein